MVDGDVVSVVGSTLNAGWKGGQRDEVVLVPPPLEEGWVARAPLMANLSSEKELKMAVFTLPDRDKP